MNATWVRYLILLAVLFYFNDVKATHIRAADITAERIGEKRYKFVLSVYSDFDNVSDNPNSANPNDLTTTTVCIGGVAGNCIERTINRTTINQIVPGVTFENIYEFEHEFPTSGLFIISFTGNKRNANVQNIPNSSAVDLYVESFIFIDPLSPLNTTPKFTFPPINIAANNQVYTYNPGTYDADGDSLSFELIPSKGLVGEDIAGYVYPDDDRFGSSSSFTIDPLTGLITWDTPLRLGEYNVAFRVNEYRNGVRIGYVIRDMQILVIESDNNPPVLIVPEDTCIGSNTNYLETIRASDPDDDNIEIDLYGGFAEEGGELKNVSFITPSNLTANVSWQPSCSVVSKTPVNAVAAVNDIHPQSNLYTVKDWNISIFGESPVLQSAIPNGNTIKLEWQSYVCKPDRGQIKIYRAACDTSQVIRSSCVGGVPDFWGFQEIGTVDISETSFTDNGGQASLVSGIEYYYMIFVDFGSPSFGESYASNIISAGLNLESALITKLSFDKVVSDKEVIISWDHFVPSTVTYQPPFTYSIFSDAVFVADTILPQLMAGSVALDTSLLDLEKVVKINVFDNLGRQVGVSSIAQFEKLNLAGTDQAVNLTWTNNNQWFYSDTLYQKVYYFIPGGDTILIDSVSGGIIDYTIRDLENGDSVCAYLDLSYTYCFNGLDTVFNSFTNTSCVLVQDNIPPCPPVLSIDLIDCNNPIAGNQLSWTYSNTDLVCNDDVFKFELQRQKIIDEGEFMPLEEFSGFNFSGFDEEGEELMCYRILAIDSSQNVSEPSNIVCQDFCGDIILPNVITPNGDGTNDVLTSSSSFVGYNNLLFTVYNRWGKEVYRDTDFDKINWDATTNKGDKVADGTYYVYVSGTRKTGTKDKVEYKGWLVVTN